MPDRETLPMINYTLKMRNEVLGDGDYGEVREWYEVKSKLYSAFTHGRVSGSLQLSDSHPGGFGGPSNSIASPLI